ncbi:head-tail adaptor protein [Sphingomonas arantia]|uniref:Head-tail adaptor protein n=1 Tax=Sphingomonas arantia TaxID=1460676 RepID=A0ABW4TZY6_9SPHN
MSDITLRSEDLPDRIAFQRKVAATGFASAGQEEWVPVDTVWAGVQDLLPSRSERTDDGLVLATGRARVRIRWRDDITADMRILHGERVMQIIAGPAMLGRRGGLEMMAEDYSTAGGTA